MLKGRAFRFGDNVDINISYIIPTVMCLAIIGSYAVNSSFVDIFVMAGTGIMSFLLVKFGFGLGPVVLGFILGPMAEDGLRRTLSLAETEGSVWVYLFGRPISVVLICITLLMVGTAFWGEYRRRGKNGTELKSEEADS